LNGSLEADLSPGCPASAVDAAAGLRHTVNTNNAREPAQQKDQIGPQAPGVRLGGLAGTGDRVGQRVEDQLGRRRPN
jgi:hypothetical protein